MRLDMEHAQASGGGCIGPPTAPVQRRHLAGGVPAAGLAGATTGFAAESLDLAGF